MIPDKEYWQQLDLLLQPLRWNKSPRHIVASSTLKNSASYTSLAIIVYIHRSIPYSSSALRDTLCKFHSGGEISDALSAAQPLFMRACCLLQEINTMCLSLAVMYTTHCLSLSTRCWLFYSLSFSQSWKCRHFEKEVRLVVDGTYWVAAGCVTEAFSITCAEDCEGLLVVWLLWLSVKTSQEHYALWGP